MSYHESQSGKWFWTVGILGLAWNAIGIVTFLMTVTLTQDALDAMPPAERALHADVPLWVNLSYAIAVFGGTVGCALLLLRKSLAVPALLLSLAGILVQMGHALFFTEMLQVLGPSAAVLPIMIIAVAAYLLWFSVSARRRGRIR